MTSFSAQVDEMTRRAREKLELVVKQSAQDVFELAQTPQPSVTETGGAFEVGKIPVDTGFLRNSFMSELNGSGAVTGADAYVMTIASLELGDTVFGGWTASYAPLVEWGTANMAGRFFALSAAQQWQAIVQRNAEKARAL